MGDIKPLLAELERRFGERFDPVAYEERVAIMAADNVPRPEWSAYLLECKRLGVKAPGQLELGRRAVA